MSDSSPKPRKDVGPEPNLFIIVAIVIMSVALVLSMIFGEARAQSEEIAPIGETWGCDWFPYVKFDDWNSQYLHRVKNIARIGWDTNNDGKEDVVHIYKIEGLGS